jgi:hypothetical protein
MKNLAGLPHSRHFGPPVTSPGVRLSMSPDRQTGPSRERTRNVTHKVTRQQRATCLGLGLGEEKGDESGSEDDDGNG